MGRRLLQLLAIALPLLLLGLWAFRPAAPDPVDVVTATRGPIEASIRVTGRVINDRTVTLTALVDGQIHGMLVQKGDRVEAGQGLAYFDRREADATLGKAQAEVVRAQQSVAELRSRLRRQREVAQVGGVSAQTVEELELELRANEAALQVAQADLRLAAIRREKVEVTAPFDGVITAKSTEVGQWVEAGIVLFTLVALEGREIEANVDAGDSGLVRLDQAVVVTCDAFPGKSWSEQVSWIAPAITEGDRDALNTFAVRTGVGPDAPPLLLGQQVDLRIRTAYREDALRVPYGALIEDGAETRVARVRDGVIHLVPVVTGIEDLTAVEIREGLSPGDSVALPRGRQLREGERVETREVQPR